VKKIQKRKVTEENRARGRIIPMSSPLSFSIFFDTIVNGTTAENGFFLSFLRLFSFFFSLHWRFCGIKMLFLSFLTYCHFLALQISLPEQSCKFLLSKKKEIEEYVNTFLNNNFVFHFSSFITFLEKLRVVRLSILSLFMESKP
jgi:hypothetical protein